MAIIRSLGSELSGILCSVGETGGEWKERREKTEGRKTKSNEAVYVHVLLHLNVHEQSSTKSTLKKERERERERD